MRVIIQEEALRRSEGRCFRHFIQELPTIDAVPVAPASLKETGFAEAYCRWGACTHCGADNVITNKFCCECGAKLLQEKM